MLLVTNMPRFPEQWSDPKLRCVRAVPAHSLREFLKASRPKDAVIVVDGQLSLILKLVLAFRAAPWRRRPIVAVDLVLRRPNSWKSRWSRPVKRLLLGGVDHFIHYFRDIGGYDEVFGIDASRSSFVPFKVNILDRTAAVNPSEGEYILCLGRSQRDYDTFFDAVERLPYPAAIAEPDPDKLRAHGSRFTRKIEDLPGNVALLPDRGDDDSTVRLLSGAKIVCLPIVKSSMAASGIGIGLNAMFLGRCVVASEGPGMSDVFQDEILVAPPEDPEALAAVIESAWTDDALRRRVAAAGRAYAVGAGGEQQLYERIALVLLKVFAL